MIRAELEPPCIIVVERESNMRLLKNTPTPLNGETTRPTRSPKKKGNERRPIGKGQENRHRKPPPYYVKVGGRGENVSTEERKTEVALQR